MMTEYIRARAPLRISLAGDGTDLDPYMKERSGHMVSASINKYAYCTLKAHASKAMSVRSTYFGIFESPTKQPLKLDVDNGELIKSVVDYFDVKKGFDVNLYSDVPAGSGLGGSSAMIVAMISAFANWLETDISKEELSKLAYHLEREVIGLDGGWQDQYQCTFGGVNSLEFEDQRVNVVPLNLDPVIYDELQCRSVLCYAGRPKHCADITKAQIEDYKNGSNLDYLEKSKKLALEMESALKTSDYDLMGEIIDKEWACKKKLSKNVTNREVDRLIKIGKSNGAIGGKLTGAGGGGFMYLLCEYDLKVDVVEALKDKGAEVTDFVFESSGGVVSWRNNNE